MAGIIMKLNWIIIAVPLKVNCITQKSKFISLQERLFNIWNLIQVKQQSNSVRYFNWSDFSKLFECPWQAVNTHFTDRPTITIHLTHVINNQDYLSPIGFYIFMVSIEVGKINPNSQQILAYYLRPRKHSTISALNTKRRLFN